MATKEDALGGRIARAIEHAMHDLDTNDMARLSLREDIVAEVLVAFAREGYTVVVEPDRLQIYNLMLTIQRKSE